MPIEGVDEGTGLGTDPAAGTDLNPLWRLTVDGSVVGLATAGIQLRRLLAYATNQDPVLEFAVLGGVVGSLPDPYTGKSILLEADWGSGWTTLFRGRCLAAGHAYGEHGWERSYTARGLSYLASRVALTNPEDGTDQFFYNLAPDDAPHYNAAYAGRTIGWILADLLSAPAHAVAMHTLGVGDYSGSGRGAAATASINGAGAVVVTVTEGGSGYSNAAVPRACLIGGAGGGWTSTTVTVGGTNSDEVVSITVAGDNAWTEAPQVWISPLPLDTLRDLGQLTLVPPMPVRPHGERLFDVADGLLQEFARNWHLWIDPEANVIRLKDQRAFAGPDTFDLDDAADRVHLSGLRLSRSVEDCWQRLRVRGGPNVRTALVGILPPDGTAATDNGLAWDCGHSGLTDSQAKAIWRLADFVQPGDVPGRATATATRAGSGITAVTINSGGYGYPASTSGIPMTFSGGGGSGANYTATSDAYGKLTSTTQVAVGTGYTSTPTVTVDPPPGALFDSGLITSITPGTSSSVVTIDPTDARRTWPANFWDQTASGRAGILFLLDTTAGITSRFAARVVASASLSAGGTCALTVEGNVPTGYDAYELFGLASPSSYVWRKLTLTDPAYVGKVLERFPFPVSYRWADGAAASMTSFPAASVLYSSSGAKPFRSTPIGFSVRNDTGHLLLDAPAVVKFADSTSLEVGGTDLEDFVSDIQAILPIADGNLDAIWPADSGGYPQYDGSSTDDEGLEETLTVTIADWIDPANQDNMDAYAADLLDAHKDATIEGSIPLLRFHGPILATFGRKARLNAAYSLPWDGVDLPIMSAELLFARGPAVRYRTHLAVSNRRWAASESQFVRPPGMPFGLQLGGLEGLNNADFGGPMTGVSLFNPTAGSGFRDPSTWTASGPGAQSVMRLSEGLRSGAIGPMGAAIGARNSLLNTASTLSPFTFGGNGGGGENRVGGSPRDMGPHRVTLGAAGVQAAHERAARWQGDPTAFLPPQTVQGMPQPAAPLRADHATPGAAERQRWMQTQQMVGMAPQPLPARVTPSPAERLAPGAWAARWDRTVEQSRPMPVQVRDWQDDQADGLAAGG
jgi:hypothetical protein